jgi:hypothetical protein
VYQARCLLTNRTLEPLPVHGEDGAEVHVVRVAAVHDLSDDYAVGALRGMERIAVCEHVGRRRALPDAVVRALAAARHLHLQRRENRVIDAGPTPILHRSMGWLSLTVALRGLER